MSSIRYNRTEQVFTITRHFIYTHYIHNIIGYTLCATMCKQILIHDVIQELFSITIWDTIKLPHNIGAAGIIRNGI